MFVSVVGLALITAVFCAIWPLGLPISKPFGSAFSPATAEVAIHRRTEHFSAKAERIAKDDAHPSPDVTPTNHQSAILPEDVRLSPPPLHSDLEPSFGLSADPPSSADLLRPYPRGPPIA